MPRVRVATAADADLVAALRIAFLCDVRGIAVDALPPALEDETRSFVASAHRLGALHSWLAEERDEVAGVVSLLLHLHPPRPGERGTHEAYIINMYVAPDHRRRGVGRALLDACIASAGEHGIKRFHLHATPDGRPLYESAGFVHDDDRLELRVS